MQINPKLITILLSSVFITQLSHSAVAPPDIPSEKTAALFGADVVNGLRVETRETKDAINGVCAIPTRNYQVMTQIDLPEGDGELHVWVRYRAMALQMKTRTDEGLKEFPWSWQRHNDGFAWRRVGTFSREELGRNVLFMSDTRQTEDSGLDGIVVTEDPNWYPPGFYMSEVGPAPLGHAPDAANATVQAEVHVEPESDEPGEATVRIDWQIKGGDVHPFIYSLNNFRGSIPERMARPEWRSSIDYMAPRLLRIHNSGLVRGWYDDEVGEWNYDRIRESLTLGTPPEGTVRMININSWPASFDSNEDRRLDEDRIEDFAAFCAELVRFVNIELGLDIEYWEVTNEKDFAYWRRPSPGLEADVPALAHLYNVAAKAMREVDPSIKIGGPVACSPLPIGPIIEFAVLTQDQLDFVSFHHYATGNNTETDQTIYEKAHVMAQDTEAVIKRLREAIPDHQMEVHLNEFNICYSWRIPEPRMRNHKGAVFDAISLISYAQVDGLTATNAWNDQDGVYGKVSTHGELRPAAHVYHYFNRLLHGSWVEASSSVRSAVVPFAIAENEDGKPAFVLVNRTNGIQTVTLENTSHTPTGDWLTASIDENGHHSESSAHPYDAPIALPPHSVHFFWQAP